VTILKPTPRFALERTTCPTARWNLPHYGTFMGETLTNSVVRRKLPNGKGGRMGPSRDHDQTLCEVTRMSANANQKKHWNLMVTLALPLFVVAACVSTEGVPPRNGSRSAVAQPKEDAQVSSLPSCLESCGTLDCLQACVNHYSDQWSAFLRRAEGKVPVKTPLWVEQRTQEALGNVRFCTQRFCNAKKVDTDSFTTCAWAASQLFLGQTGWETDPSLKPETRADLLDALTLILRVAEIEERAGVAEGNRRARAETIRSERMAATNGNEPQAAGKPTFQQCHKDFDVNNALCDTRYENGDDSKTVCVAAAKTARHCCLKKIY